jgi:hypothetical protein
VGGFLCFVVVAGLAGVLIWQFIETKNAVAITSLETSYEPAQVVQIVGNAFEGARAVLWTTASGPGTINMRRRGFRGGITMSVAVKPKAGGGSRVEMWATDTVIYLGVLVNFAGVVNRRKHAIGRSLAA